MITHALFSSHHITCLFTISVHTVIELLRTLLVKQIGCSMWKIAALLPFIRSNSTHACSRSKKLFVIRFFLFGSVLRFSDMSPNIIDTSQIFPEKKIYRSRSCREAFGTFQKIQNGLNDISIESKFYSTCVYHQHISHYLIVNSPILQGCRGWLHSQLKQST